MAIIPGGFWSEIYSRLTVAGLDGAAATAAGAGYLTSVLTSAFTATFC